LQVDNEGREFALLGEILEHENKPYHARKLSGRPRGVERSLSCALLGEILEHENKPYHARKLSGRPRGVERSLSHAS
jgi:uncharacterized protein (UPF0147 family)